ncbi:hypothetical protein [Acrocarpospora catenulata]|uniref:hypothetical protein n=1 Tax=Acrocarpospora catenulata TaxID=2836182 RepID=UPI001BD9C5FE|nr:hypothetical protein [Acrocarpospora catenulata]
MVTPEATTPPPVEVPSPAPTATQVQAVDKRADNRIDNRGGDDADPTPTRKPTGRSTEKPAAAPTKKPVRKPTKKPSKPAELTLPVELAVRSVIQFDQLKGKPQWTSGSQARLAGSRWKFNSSGNFTVYADANLFPLTGSYTREDATTLHFEASASNVNPGGTSFTSLTGTLVLLDSGLHVAGAWSSGATYGATVNDQDFASSTSSMYEFEIEVA